MAGSGLPAPHPVVTPETAPFWSAAAQGELLLPLCRACGEVYWYPRAKCPRCHSLDTTWRAASGRGTLYAFTVVRRPAGEYAGGGSYVLAFVELAEGPRIMTNVVPCDPARLMVGAAVEVVFDRTNGEEEAALYRFRLVERTT